MDVKSGESVVLGGLITQSVSEEGNKVFLLGDIPLLGWLFKSKSDVTKTNELIFIITPYIVENGVVLNAKEVERAVSYPVFE